MASEARTGEASSSAPPLWDHDRLLHPHSQHDKAERVRRMFDGIAPTYRRVNALASAGRDRLWRRNTVRLAEVRPTDSILDIACGPGDLAEMFSRAAPRRIVGLDFARQMLLRCPQLEGVHWIQGDALQLPFADGCFDIASCAFGIRNFQVLEQGLREMFRVLKPGGRIMILEFGMPSQSLLRRIYHFYFARIMPRLANWISRDRTGAYDYLPQSVVTFLTPRQIAELLRRAGFEAVRAVRKTFGIVYIYRADKPPTR